MSIAFVAELLISWELRTKGGKTPLCALSGLSVQFSRLIEADRLSRADLRNFIRSANYTIGRRLIAAEHTICLINCAVLLRLDALDAQFAEMACTR